MKATSPEIIELIVKARDKGFKQKAIAEALGVSQPLVSKVLKRHDMAGTLPSIELDITKL